MLLHREGGARLLLVVDVVDVGGLRDGAPASTRGVGGGNVDVVRDPHQVAFLVGAGLAQLGEECLRADDVGHERLVDGRVEGHVTCAVQQDVEVAREVRHRGQVALDHLDALGHQLLHPSGGGDDVGEDLLLQQALDALFRGDGALPPDQHRGCGVGALGEHLPQQLFADEPGDAGHGDLLASEQLGDPPVEQGRHVHGVGVADPEGTGRWPRHHSCPSATSRASSMVKRPT